MRKRPRPMTSSICGPNAQKKIMLPMMCSQPECMNIAVRSVIHPCPDTIPAEIVSGHGWITLLTAMFMHSGWLHIIGNMIFFWAFGPQIEDVMGRGRFLIFYLLGGLIAM